ncbi:hypothetical protein T440DRAFT_396669 [Plenodomus tracheiphilus IPT5]|uniref:Lytic polysaccharide monooxygenase n=1 Tax=Plenodomus tracheiphilus IPT5 TaxID=1408161 RepID=A0A6A7B825_9PLEO|nr:hypothetical protein T440DRAFT_396669 [Plenodomus tracheiphilus IPT5]
MQLITFISAATAMVATASARSAVTLNQECDTEKPHARIVNRCDYPVHLWSVLKGDGCPGDGMVTLNKGETYSENYDKAKDATGVSIKISKTQQCKGNDIVQLEYFLNQAQGQESFWGNYLDVSYVDCLTDDCPTRNEGYYLVAGNQTGAATASAGNTWCPILSCHDAVSCAKCSYILPDDVQTKTCDVDSSMTFYMCGGDAPTEDHDSAPAASSAVSQKAQSSAPAPSSNNDGYKSAAPSSIDDGYKVKAAAVTPAPTPSSVPGYIPGTKTHVEVVYVTAYEYVNAKRHAHGHARRHQQFHA